MISSVLQGLLARVSGFSVVINGKILLVLLILNCQFFLKTSYLTIDDSPSSKFLEHCDYLNALQIPAVFFCIGKNLEVEADAVIKAIKMGFKIQNHSYSHPHFSSISLKEACDQIAKTDEIITALYLNAGYTYHEKWFRFPYGDKGDGKFGQNFKMFPLPDLKRANYIQDFLKEMGYTKPKFKNVNYSYLNSKRFNNDIDLLWTFDIMEWAIIKQNIKGLETMEDVLERVESRKPKDYLKAYGNRKRWLGNHDSDEIILLHDHIETSVEFKNIINKLISLQIEFKAL